MSPNHLLALILVLSAELTKAIPCEIPHESKTRIFYTLTQYQGNVIPFNFTRPNWAGSTVEFNFTMEKIQKNDLLTYESQAIITLKLTARNIKQIDEGAFSTLYCLHELLLDENNISQLSKNVFSDLGNLVVLQLSDNNLESLHDFVFAHLGRLKILTLSKNKIKILESLAFHNLTNLEVLDLGWNRIKTVPSDVFKPVVGLKKLVFNFNLFADLEFEKWDGLNNLTELNLAGNGLYRFDPSYHFPFLALQSLNLSSNQLLQLNAEVLSQRLPNLGIVDINGNPWFCDVLKLILNQLRNTRIKAVSRNDSRINVNGIGCRDVPFTPTTKTTIADDTTTNTSIWVDKDLLERYVEKKIETNNQIIISSISHLQTLVTILFVVISVIIVYGVLKNTNLCKRIFSRCRRSDTHLDISEVENFSLLHH